MFYFIYFFVFNYRAIVNDVQGKTLAIQSSMGQGGGGYDQVDMKNHLNNIQEDVRTLINRPQQVK